MILPKYKEKKYPSLFFLLNIVFFLCFFSVTTGSTTAISSEGTQIKTSPGSTNTPSHTTFSSMKTSGHMKILDVAETTFSFSSTNLDQTSGPPLTGSTPNEAPIINNSTTSWPTVVMCQITR